MNHPDPAIRDRTSEYLSEAVDFCADVGANLAGISGRFGAGLLPGGTGNRRSGWTRETLAAAVRRGNPAE